VSRTTASFFLLLYHNQVLGLPESWVGLGIMLALVADALIGPAPVALRLAGLFPPNGASALLPLLFAFGTVTIALMIMSSILTSSMVADIVEDSEVSTGRRSEGVFVAANSFVQKAVSGIGIFASSLLLGAIGFPQDAKPGQVDPQVVSRLGLVYARPSSCST
jgi:glycoside/pentoside/hexuronide:cation symporter, GPH family